MSILHCPVCRSPLSQSGKSFLCANRHSFDIAKEGYVNLLTSGKSGSDMGDNKAMAVSRRDFLNKGFYSILADAVIDSLRAHSDDGDPVLDICCGEGYYTACAASALNRAFYGFDLSRSMVRLAARRKCGASFFVANIASIPIADASVKAAFHLFAPFHAPEFRRILSAEGVLITAIPGRNHLFGLKSVLYDTPYYNDEKEPVADGLEVIDRIRVSSEITMTSGEDIHALFQMTPYYYHTPSEGMKRLDELKRLSTEIEFVLVIYRKIG